MDCGLFHLCMGRVMMRKAQHDKISGANAVYDKKDVAVITNNCEATHRANEIQNKELLIAKNESDEILRVITDEQIALLEKEKVMLQLEVKNLSSRLGKDFDEQSKMNTDNITANHFVDADKIENVREIYEKEVSRHKNDVENLQQKLDQARSSIDIFKMEAESKDISIEKLKKKVDDLEAQIKMLRMIKASMNDASLTPNSNSLRDNEKLISLSTKDDGNVTREGWLWLPAKNKTNPNTVTWKKYYVIMRGDYLLFYKGEVDRMSVPPAMKITMSKLLHVSPVTPNDIHKAESKDIPADKKNMSKIFQILYEDDAESNANEDRDKNGKTITYKGHHFKLRHFKSVVTCNACRMPIEDQESSVRLALECPRCLMKCHKEHVEENEVIAECKAQCCITLLVMASSVDDQRIWVEKLSEKMVHKGLTRVDSKRNASGMTFVTREQAMKLETTEENLFQRSVSTADESSVSDQGVINAGFQGTPEHSNNVAQGLMVYYE